jgi:predicted phosphodiesterase
MRYLSTDLGDIELAYIIPISDIHIGDPLVDYEKLYGYLNWVKENPAWIILNGDLMTCDIKQSVGDVYKQELNPQQQLDELVKIFTPFKDRILAIIQGNHEQRITREVGVDILRVFTQILGIEDKYDPDSALVHIRLGKDRSSKRIGYTIFATHGWSNGRKAGGKLNAIQELRNVILADCYIASHTHTQGAIVEKYLVPDYRNRKILEIKQVFVSAGSFLKYGSYAERRGMPIAKTGTPRIRLDGTKKDIHVSL